jgi:hypothetical protein
MGYYMRFIVEDETTVSIDEVEAVLIRLDSRYLLAREVGDQRTADIFYNDSVYGQIEINVPGDGLFEEEIGELIEFIEDSAESKREAVIEKLNNTKSIFCIQVLFQGRTVEETLEKLAPIWDWCFRSRAGLLQVDGEGYYDASGLVLKDQ